MLETLVRRLHMVRLTVAAAAALALMGCTGLIDESGGDGLTTEQAAAKQAWLTKAQPVLAAFCVTCHNGSRANIGFVEGDTPIAQRDDLIAFTPAVVNMTAPQSSRILTKGIHEGPQLSATQASDILEWLQKEKDARPDDGGGGPILETAQFLPLICSAGAPGDPTCPFNDVTLDEIGAPGSKIQFTAQALGSGLYVSNLKLIPGAMGAYLEHPLFVSHPEGAEPMPDTIDRFFSVKMNLEMTATAEQQQIAGGTAAFVGFLANAKLTIHFKALKTFQVDGGGGGGGGGTTRSGCQALGAFKTIRTAFTANIGGAANNCNACHGGQNGGATGALNLTGIGSADDAVVLNACNQVLIRVNLTTPDSSGVFLAPDPGSTHPFRYTAAQLNVFKNGPPGTGVLGWINAEKVAP